MRTPWRSTLAGGAILALLALLAGQACVFDSDEKGAGCPDDLVYFEQQLAPLLAKCSVCHSADGLARGTRMVLLPWNEPGAIEANYETVKAIARESIDGESILLLRPTGRHPEGHTGGKLFEVGSSPYEDLARFVRRTQGQSCDEPWGCSEAGPGPGLLRRLSHREYDRTVADLLGVPSSHGATFTEDTIVNGFDNNAAALTASPLYADQLRRAAEDLARTAVTDRLVELAPCDVAADPIEDCIDGLIETLGPRAFRRPLDEEEVARYHELSLAHGETVEEASEVFISALLQSPNFLYRTEIGAGELDANGYLALTPFEIASELSYLIWGTMPDDELFEAAAAGELATPEQIEAQARRLLADPRFLEVADEFADQWLDLTRLPTKAKDAEAFPDLTPEIRQAMHDETAAFIAHVVADDGGSLTELLTAPYTFMSAELAAFYGLTPPSGDGFEEVDFAPGDAHLGVLTQGGFLTVHAMPNESSPIHRGKAVRERLLCEDLPPPPPGIVVQPPPVDPSQTTKERFAAHASLEPCTSCHQRIDPIGFLFEHFDGVGRYRDSDNGLPIDATGEINGTTASDAELDGTVALAEHLAGSPEVHSCFVLQWYRYGYGLEDGPEDACLVQAVTTDLEASTLSMAELVVALTRTPHFTRRLGP